MKATAEVRKALQSKLEDMIRNEEPVKEVSHVDIRHCKMTDDLHG